MRLTVCLVCTFTYHGRVLPLGTYLPYLQLLITSNDMLRRDVKSLFFLNGREMIDLLSVRP